MRTNHRLIAVVSLMILCARAPASEPCVNSIDYANPKRCLEIADSLGKKAAILAQAKKLKGDSETDTLRNVLDWMRQNLKYDGEKAYAWRNYDDVLREKAYGGCADEGIVCGVLLKGAGIPTVWVKTMDVSWIWDFKKGRPFKSWSGHVFLEVFVNGQWMLLDPGARTIYKDYTPKARILPGNRFAYHKGNDPKSMIMSLQWEEWKRQTKDFFRTLDESMLPVDPNNTLSLFRQVYVVGNSPYYQIMSEAATVSGLSVAKSFNAEYDTYLPQARGHVLLIETHKGKPIVSVETIDKFFPGARRGLEGPAKSIQIDGTTVVFLEFGKQLNVLSEEESDKAKKSANKSIQATK